LSVEERGDDREKKERGDKLTKLGKKVNVSLPRLGTVTNSQRMYNTQFHIA
jgi:hypothetical protein